MAFVDDCRQTFDAAEFCETVKAGVGEGRITSNAALRDGVAVSAATKTLQGFADMAPAPVGPDVVAAYITYSPGAPELFTALRAVSVSMELVAVALECLTCIVKYSLDGSKPQQALEHARSVVKEIVKSRAVLIYDILATDGKACAKKALNLLRLVAMCHPMLAKELVNRFDLSAKPMAPSLCSVTNNHCRVPFLDLMFVILACGERDVLHYLAGKGREVIVTCLRTIQERTTLEVSGGVGSSIKSILWKQGKPAGKKRPKVLPSHVQKRELVAAINFLLAMEKHLFSGLNKSSRGALAHPIPTLLAALAATEIPPMDIAPREVQEEHEALRSAATRMFIAIAKDPRVSTPAEAVKALNNPSFNFGSEAVVKFISEVIQEKPQIATHLLKSGRILSAPPALTLRWFGYCSVIASCILRLPSPITTFREKRFFEKCLSHADPLIRHIGTVLALSFCKVMDKRMTAEQRADDYLPSIDVIQKIVMPGTNEDTIAHKLVAAYQSVLQKQVFGTDVKLMIFSVDTAGDDIMVAAGAIEGALRNAPYTAVRKVVHKRYLSKLITKASQTSRRDEAMRIWRVCSLALRCTDLFQQGTESEIDVYLSVLSSHGKEAEEPAKAFEAMIAQALEMPYGLYDRLHSDEWSEENTTTRTSQLAVASVIKIQKLADKRSSTDGRACDLLFEQALKRMVLSIVASSSVLHRGTIPNSYLTAVLPSVLNNTNIWWKTTATEEEKTTAAHKNRGVARKLVDDRGTYPKTKFLRLIEALTTFDRSLDTRRREDITPKANVELGLAWDSWCDYWLSDSSFCPGLPSSKTSMNGELSRGQSDVIIRGLLRFLLDACYPSKVEVDAAKDLRTLRQVLTPNDYHFAIAMMVKTVEDVPLRYKLYEELLSLVFDMSTHDSLQAEESEFLYESVIRSIARKSDWSPEHINKVLSFCISVMSKWNKLSMWEMHVAYSIAIMKALLSHPANNISMHCRAFLSKVALKSLPPLVKLTSETIKNLLLVFGYSPCVRGLAVAQVHEWSEKEHRSCCGVLLRLISASLIPIVTTTKNGRDNEELLLKRFVKASLKSKVVWVSNSFSKEDRENFYALDSIARKISQARGPCEQLLQRLFRSESGFSGNSWMLLAAILESSTHTGSTPEMTSPELEKVLRLIIRYIGSFGKFEGGYPELACLQVLESVIRLLRLRKFSFYSTSSSIDQDVSTLCSNLTDCLYTRFNSFASVESELPPDGIGTKKIIDVAYLASLLTCHAEILKLDLCLENAAKGTLIKLAAGEGRIIQQCLQTQEVDKDTDYDFPRTRDPATQLMALLQAALPWLSHAKCDEDVARSVLCLQTIMSSQLSEIASGRSERHSSVRECVRMVSYYVRANDVERKFSSPLGKTSSIGTETGTALIAFPKPLLEEASEYILQRSYQAKDTIRRSRAGDTKQLDPFFVLTTFLRGSRQALLQPRAPVIDLHRIARDGILALAVTGVASTSEDLRALSYACLEAFAAVVGPAAGVPPGSAAGLYKDRKQLAFLLELLRNSISDPLSQVLPLFAVWFRTAVRIVLSPGHAANKLVTTLILRAPCMDISDCYGMSYLMNCEASGSELQAIRLLAFEILQKGIYSQRDVAVIRRMRVFDKIFMFAASAMGFDSSIRLGALKALEAILNRDESLDICDELVGAHGIVVWLASDAKHIGETTEELFSKLNIIRCAAENFVRRRSTIYASVLANSLSLFVNSRLRSTTTAGMEQEILKRIAECGASMALIVPEKRGLFRVNFADLWVNYMSKNVTSYTCKRNFVRCICRQRDTVMRLDILEMLLEHAAPETDVKKQANSDLELSTDDLSMIHIFVAECLLALRYEANKAEIITPDLCYLLAKAVYFRSTIWLLLAAVTTLDLCSHLSDKLVPYTDKIPAFPPQELKPHFEQQWSSTVDEIRLVIVDELIACGDKLTQAPSQAKIVNAEANGNGIANGIH